MIDYQVVLYHWTPGGRTIQDTWHYSSDRSRLCYVQNQTWTHFIIFSRVSNQKQATHHLHFGAAVALHTRPVPIIVMADDVCGCLASNPNACLHPSPLARFGERLEQPGQLPQMAKHSRSNVSCESEATCAKKAHWHALHS